MANKKRTEEWFEKAADLMVREGKTLPQVVSELGLEITSGEAANLARTKGFQQALWQARNRYQKELADMPGRGKEQAKGLAVWLVQKLVEEGKYDKAIDALMKLAKLEGWTEPETQVNVFGGLNQQQYDALKSKLQGLREPARSSSERASETICDA